MIDILRLIIEVIVKALYREGILNKNEAKRCDFLLDEYKERIKPKYSDGVKSRQANLFFKAAKLVNLKRELTNKESRILGYCQRSMKKTNSADN
ncbi:MAG: hypothetical protein AB8G86_26025 [Saprospiraceae bacterium]